MCAGARGREVGTGFGVGHDGRFGDCEEAVGGGGEAGDRGGEVLREVEDAVGRLGVLEEEMLEGLLSCQSDQHCVKGKREGVREVTLHTAGVPTAV